MMVGRISRDDKRCWDVKEKKRKIEVMGNVGSTERDSNRKDTLKGHIKSR
jgi:hypothetical protein